MGNDYVSRIVAGCRRINFFIVWARCAFFGGILSNIQGVIEALGSEGLGLIIAIMIILNVWKQKS